MRDGVGEVWQIKPGERQRGEAALTLCQAHGRGSAVAVKTKWSSQVAAVVAEPQPCISSPSGSGMQVRRGEEVRK